MKETNIQKVTLRAKLSVNAVKKLGDLSFITLISFEDKNSETYRELLNVLNKVSNIFDLKGIAIYNNHRELVAATDPLLVNEINLDPSKKIITTDKIIRVIEDIELENDEKLFFSIYFDTTTTNIFFRGKRYFLLFFVFLLLFFLVYSYFFYKRIYSYIKMEEAIFIDNKLSAFGILGFNITHKIKNSLQILRFKIENEDNIDQEKKEKLFSIIDDISQDTSDILNFSNKTTLNVSEINLKNEIEGIIKKKNDIIKRRGLILIKKLDKIKIKGDIKMLSLALENVIDNAFKYSKDGGKVEISLFKGRSIVILRISNEINTNLRAILKRIGEPFFTTSESGNGIGIFLARSIFAIHNGKTKITNRNKKFHLEVKIRRR
jgi:signal transduction histidine kinase